MTEEQGSDERNEEEDEGAGPEEEELIFQPRLRDLDAPGELRQYTLEFKDRDSTETVRCHEVLVEGGVVRFTLRLKAGGSFLALMVPLGRVDAIEEELYDEEYWGFDHEYRSLPW